MRAYTAREDDILPYSSWASIFTAQERYRAVPRSVASTAQPRANCPRRLAAKLQFIAMLSQTDMHKLLFGDAPQCLPPWGRWQPEGLPEEVIVDSHEPLLTFAALGHPPQREPLALSFGWYHSTKHADNLRGGRMISSPYGNGKPGTLRKRYRVCVYENQGISEGRGRCLAVYSLTSMRMTLTMDTRRSLNS